MVYFFRNLDSRVIAVDASKLLDIEAVAKMEWLFTEEPFNGVATGSGGELRDRKAGRMGKLADGSGCGLYAISYLLSRGRAAIVRFPGIFYRVDAEQKIGKYVVDNNFVDIEAKDNREKVDITNLNTEISKTVAKINTLLADIDAI